MKNLIATIKSWNIENARKLKDTDKANEWHIATSPEELSFEKVAEINPRYIFVPHWSWIIPKEIWGNYETVVFHETDLPFGRGSRPVQNLIIQGYDRTKISALKVDGEVDAGQIYLKKDLDISRGGVHEILESSSEIIFNEMIPEIIRGVKPYEQSWDDVDSYFVRPNEGRPVKFERKTIKESANLLNLLNNSASPKQIQRTIRALQDDYECGDPRVYLPVPGGRMEFYGASIIGNDLHAQSEFVRDKND